VTNNVGRASGSARQTSFGNLRLGTKPQCLKTGILELAELGNVGQNRLPDLRDPGFGNLRLGTKLQHLKTGILGLAELGNVGQNRLPDLRVRRLRQAR
jgi:hypothetical protein